MKLILRFFQFLFCFVLSTALLAESEAQYESYLKSQDDSQIATALEYFGKEKKDKSKSATVVSILKSNSNPKVVTRAATALGYFAETGQPVDALKWKIENDKNPEIVYACLVALFAIQTKAEKPEEAILEAFRFADSNRRGDELVSRFLDRVKDRVKF